MDNKELPQGMVNEMYHYIRGKGTHGNIAIMCAGSAKSHYEPIIEAKDTTINEQAEKIEKMTRAFKEVYTEFGVSDEDFDYWLEQHGI